MLKKLRIKFVCINMTIVTVMLAVILSTVVQFTRANLEQISIQTMEELSVSPLRPIKLTDNFDIRPPYFSLELNKSGDLLKISDSYYDLSDRALLEELVESSFSASENTGLLKDYNLRFMRVSTPTSQFLIFMDISTEISTIKNLTRNCIFIGILSFFVFLVISIVLANWAVKPVDKAWKHQKQFISDASHELKTPLTVILTNAELLRNSDYDTERKSQFTDNILAMAKQMRSLVEGLLELSRIDNQTIKIVTKVFNLSSLTECSIYLFEPLYFENGLELISQIEPEISVKGSDTHLKQVIDILLDNALKYASPHSRVTVRLQKQRSYCLLSVSSCGDTLSPEDLKKIFQRFYQVDKSRNHSGSYGLGLSIAESIVSAHQGKIWAESQNGVNRFFVKLPNF